MLTWISSRSPIKVRFNFQTNMATFSLETIQNSSRARAAARAAAPPRVGNLAKPIVGTALGRRPRIALDAPARIAVFNSALTIALAFVTPCFFHGWNKFGPERYICVGGERGKLVERNQLFHLQSGPQHEAVHCHSIRFPYGARTTGDPRRGGSPEN